MINIPIRHVIITIVLLLFRRDVAPIWMESLANVEIQVMSVY